MKKPKSSPAKVVKTIGDYKIERGVKMPAVHGEKVAVIRSMEVGDSVVIPRTEAHWWSGLARKCGVYLASRKISETHSRVWRVAKKPGTGSPRATEPQKKSTAK